MGRGLLNVLLCIISLAIANKAIERSEETDLSDGNLESSLLNLTAVNDNQLIGMILAVQIPKMLNIFSNFKTNMSAMILELNQKVAEISQQQKLLNGVKLKTNNRNNMKKCNDEISLRSESDLSDKLVNLTTGTYYYDDNYERNWKDAKIFCDKYGMRLVSLESMEKMTSVIKEIPQKGKCYFTSGNDMVTRPGIFYWMNGHREPVDDRLWLPGDPNYYGQGRESCILLMHHFNLLVDDDCDKKCYPLCESF